MSRQNRSSLALSDTTYYSFNDIELVEPPEPSSHSDQYGQGMQQEPQHKQDRDRFEASKMQRQDSGYESYGPSSPRNSISNGSNRPSVTVTRRSSTTTSATAACVRTARPSTRRSTRSYNNTYSGSQAPYKVRSHAQSQPIGYVQFPTPDLVELAEPTPSEAAMTAAQLPQTTHYWTSDSTRRLEYAAMDAAGRGVKGWMRKHLIPDCLVPQDSKHVSFDDDTGSVRRYRLQLEDDHDEKRHQMRQPTRRKSWRFWRE